MSDEKARELKGAAASGDIVRLASILARGDVGIDCTVRRDRDTPLIDAAKNGHTVAMRMLLDAGANPDYEGHSGTALMAYLSYAGILDLNMVLFLSRTPGFEPAPRLYTAYKKCANSDAARIVAEAMAAKGRPPSFFNF